MKNISFKNYILLALLIVLTIFTTLFLSNQYLRGKREVSNIYKYSNIISEKELTEFITENPDAIIYISNKYDLNNSDFEKKLIKKIEDLNIKEKFAFANANSKLLNEIQKEYKIKLNIANIPVLIIISDKKIINYYYIDENSDINSLIDEVFE